MVLCIGERLAWCDDDTVSRVYAHGVYVLHVTYRNAVVELVAHDLVLDFFPVFEVLFDEYLLGV